MQQGQCGWCEGWDGRGGCLSEGRVGVFVYHHVCCVLFHCKAGVLGAPAPVGDPNMSCVLVSLHIVTTSHALASATTPVKLFAVNVWWQDMLVEYFGGMWGCHCIQPLSLIRGTVCILRDIDLLYRPVSMRCWWLASCASIKLHPHQAARKCSWLFGVSGLCVYCFTNSVFVLAANAMP
jgi:hypothetical protein